MNSPQAGTPAAVRQPRLGLGTASFGSRVNRRDSTHLLHAALSAGITHIDTARAYGYGEAEWAVGDFLQGRREQVTLTTKVGILPPARSSVLSAAKGAARIAASVFPGLRARLRRRAGQLVNAGKFDAPSMAASFETSLRALRTDYVDLLLLHECAEADVIRPETQDFLLRMQREGKARQVGIATGINVAAYALEHSPQLCAALQLPAPLQHLGLDVSTSRLSGQQLLLHSFVQPCVGQARARLLADPGLARSWSDTLQLDLARPEVWARLAIQATSHQFPDATLLFGTLRAEHIRANADACAVSLVTAQLDAFSRLLADLAPSLAARGRSLS